jgi:hypothetical protein
MFLYSTASRSVLGPTQPPVRGVLGAVSLGLKRPERGPNHSPPYSAEVKNSGAINPLPHMSLLRSAQLIKPRDNIFPTKQK